MSKAEIIKSLEELSQRPGFIYSLAIVLRRDFFYPARKVTEIDWRERLSLNEVSLLMGLMVKHKVDVSAIPTNDVSDEQISLLRKLFEDLQKEYSIPFFEKVTHTKKTIKTVQEQPKGSQIAPLSHTPPLTRG